ncbi:hypothetical protein [Motiliproteus sediminis]|uniref:hypothetical protein n=1 Tax=Motiliproteus sediminis TaxID=1468178 RepID=UPI001AEFB495|nr:hypothetical protein [Motiliproteus sediminis]
MPPRQLARSLKAELRPPAGAADNGGRGKLESKGYSDGRQRLEIQLTGLAVVGEAHTVITVAGRELAQLPVTRGEVRFDHSAPTPEQMPQFSPGDRVEVKISGLLLLIGVIHAG